jgi:hypothetical protein
LVGVFFAACRRFFVVDFDFRFFFLATLFLLTFENGQKAEPDNKPDDEEAASPSAAAPALHRHCGRFGAGLP